jgi:alpha-D-ribose 1-methylphosphonate 5-triphosphate synthase subunit PhnG
MSHTDEFVEIGAAGQASRKAWLSVLSKAKPEEVLMLWDALAAPDLMGGAQVLRPPETGMVMVRGRTGGAGAPFNLGEMTVTRCAIRLGSGETGIGYVAGRNKQHAKIAAVVDAMMQSSTHHSLALEKIIQPLTATASAHRETVSRKAKATQVEFFTMVRDRKA